MEDLNKVKERIAKLLAMAADAASPNEAAIAAERARRMMDKFQLDEFDVVRDKMEFGASFGTESSIRHAAYTGTLAVAIAKYNDCNAKWHYPEKGSRAKMIMFLGYAQDVELAEQMMERLMDTIDQLCKRYMKQHFGRFVSGVGPEYKISCASAINKRLGEMCAERKALVTSSGTALVLAKQAAVDEHFGAAKYRSSSRAVSNDSAARHARAHGWTDGQKVELVKSVE